MSALVAAARRYLGVRFRHRGRTPRGLDCAGLVWLAYSDCGMDLPDFRLYGPEPHEDGLEGYTSAALGDPIALAPVARHQLAVGDVLVVRFETEPHHIAIASDYPTGGLAMLHADGHAGKVIEHRLSDQYLERITHVYRKPV